MFRLTLTPPIVAQCVPAIGGNLEERQDVAEKVAVLLTDEIAAVRLSAAEVLGTFGELMEPHAGYVLALLSEPRHEMVTAAKEALAKAGYTNPKEYAGIAKAAEDRALKFEAVVKRETPGVKKMPPGDRKVAAMAILREKKEASWKARKLADQLKRWILDARQMGVAPAAARTDG